MTHPLHLLKVDDTLLHLILTRLPLNVLWRLPGWSRRLDRVLSQELLWLERNRREFGFIPYALINNRTQVTHRLYNLIQSRDCYGSLFVGGHLEVPPTGWFAPRRAGTGRVRGVWNLDAGDHVIYSGNDLYWAAEDEIDPTLNPDERREAQARQSGFEVWGFLLSDLVYCDGYLARDRTGTNWELDIDDVHEDSPEQLPYREPLIYYRDTHTDVGLRTFRLEAGGRFIYAVRNDPSREESKLVVEGIIGVWVERYLTLLHGTGEIEVIDPDTLESIREDAQPRGPFLKLDRSGYLYHRDNAVYYFNDRARMWEQKFTAPYPIRVAHWGESLLIDGRGFDNTSRWEYSYRGIIDAQPPWVVASTVGVRYIDQI